MTKRGKEIKLDASQDYNIVYGTVDNKNPKSIYINISAWGEPLVENELNYGRIISGLSKQIKQTLYDFIKFKYKDSIMFDRNIVDLDMRESGVQYGKRSFMNCEITLFQTGELPIHEGKLAEALEDVIDEIIIGALDFTPYFKFHKKKN